MHGRWRSLTLLTAMTVLALPGAASAETFTVNSTGDEPDASAGNLACLTAANTCTLRAAIQQANAIGDPDEIALPAGTYAQATALPDVTRSVTITGAGARTTVIDGVEAIDAVLDLNGPDQAIVRDLTVTGGGWGLRVANSDALLERVIIRDNVFQLPGGVNGAGLVVEATAKVTVTRSAILRNRATSSAGLQALGAGVSVASGGTLTMLASTVAGNATESFGGISSNSFGGGVYAAGTTTLRHVTLSGNRATAGNSPVGGNIYVAAPATIDDSIIAGGTAGFGANCGGTEPLEAGRNIDSGATCKFGAGHLSNIDPQLGPLADNGGPGDSLAPALTSPARDAALACPDGGLDQRGALAPAGPACEIGSVELGADLAVAAEASRPDVAAGGDVTYIVRVTNNGADLAPGTTLDVSVAGAAAVTVATASQGTCTTTVRCEIGALARGATVTATVVVRAGASGPIAMTARATSALPDPTAGNDSAALTTAVAGSTAAAADRTRPVLGSLKLARKPRSGRAVGLRASLSEAATVRLTVTRLVTGRRVGARCTAGARRGRACTISRPTGTVSVSAMSGTPPLTIPAKLKRRPLSPGRYRISAVATDAAGNRSATRTLTIVVKR